MNQLPVLFVTTRLGGGGAEKHLWRLLNQLDRARFAPRVAVVRGGGSYEASLGDDVPVYYLTRGLVPSTTLSMLMAIGRLRQAIIRDRPQLVVGVLDPIVGLVDRALSGIDEKDRPPVVACIQNNFSRSQQNAKWPLRSMYAYIGRAIGNADLTIALSQGVLDDLQQCGFVRPHRSRVIYNAASDAQLLENSRQPCPIAKPADKRLLVACGRLSRQKGFDILLDAMPEVLRQHPVELWILGEGPDRRKLENQIKRLSLGSAVRLLGFQENPFCFFQQADLFVLSSRWEGFGNVVVEAMACGAPVLATRCPFGPDEIIAHEQTGFLSEPESSGAMSKAMIEALSDQDRLARIATAGTKRSRDFASQLIADQYADAFAELLQGDDSAEDRATTEEQASPGSS